MKEFPSMANAINEYISAFGTELVKEMNHDEVADSVCQIDIASSSMYLFNCSFIYVINAMSSLKTKQIYGIDEKRFFFVLKSRFVIASYLTNLTIFPLATEIFLEDVKLTKVLPHSKADSSIEVSIYCSISLLSSCSNVIEEISHSHWYTYLEKLSFCIIVSLAVE